MSSRIGRSGEYLVASSLERIGVQCAIVRSDNFDLVAWQGDDAWRVEVKASSNFDLAPPTTFHFHTRRGVEGRPLSQTACDIVAFVALNLRLVHFRHASVITKMSLRLQSQHFTSQGELDSWIAATRR